MESARPQTAFKANGSCRDDQRWELRLANRSTETRADGADGNSARGDRSTSIALFTSILFDDGRSFDEIQGAAEPDCFRDLHLDQLFASISASRPEYDLNPFFRAPLVDRASVLWRQEVVRDLQAPMIRSAVAAFAASQVQMRAALKEQAASRHPLEQQRWLLDAALIYCEGLEVLATTLASAAPAPCSRGLKAFARHVGGQVQSSPLQRLHRRARAIANELDRIRYSVVIRGLHVEVRPYAGEGNFASDIASAFAKFGQEGHDSALSFRISDERTQVDRKVLERVARVYPAQFAELAAFCAEEKDFADPLILRFDREVQFYLAFLERLDSLEELGLAHCLPELGTGDGLEIAGGFDLALASDLARQVPKQAAVANDAALGAGQIFVMISGPNQGGKTTFARMIGQIHYLASLGLPVPASRARVQLAETILTHFEREESLSDAGGKLHADLVRVHAILNKAGRPSLVVFNEIFTSATLEDAIRLSRAIVERLRSIGSLCVWVTFLDEIATIGADAVSMVAEVLPEEPSIRTYRIVRRPPLGLAYAQILADLYGVSYERIKERMAK
jgi:DNA mismatch repair protein MutS